MAPKKKSKVKLTFSPIMGAAAQYTALLRKSVTKGNLVAYEPLIDGLPIDFTVKKGETVEVTEEQFKELQKAGHAETDKEYKAREKFIRELSSQHPESLTWDMIVSEGANFATLRDSQDIIYNDKLIKV